MEEKDCMYLLFLHSSLLLVEDCYFHHWALGLFSIGRPVLKVNSGLSLVGGRKAGLTHQCNKM